MKESLPQSFQDPRLVIAFDISNIAMFLEKLKKRYWKRKEKKGKRKKDATPLPLLVRSYKQRAN